MTTCFVLAGGFAANAMAQDATAQTGASTSVSADQNATAEGKVAVGTRTVPAPGDRNCLRDTGSHIPPPKGGCLPVAGRSYSHEDIQRTGQTDIGQALQQLDPSVTSGH
ncbi:MAG: hypothetical protein JSS21_02875 [Proteobacteria bacterium]|nr:hypothetical protein [Pseudomonadota bacterium]